MTYSVVDGFADDWATDSTAIEAYLDSPNGSARLASLAVEEAIYGLVSG